MVKYLLATLLALCPVLAYAQSTIIVEQTLSGDPIGSGYSAANGALYAPTSASLQSLALPFTISYDLISPSAPSSTANYMYSGVNSPNTGFNIFYNTTFAPDIYHLQAAIRPAAGTAITGASCDGTGKMCWRPPLDNVSHHYCWVFTPNHMWWYLDGIVRDESITPGTFTASSITWTLLQSGIPANNTLFDVRTYSRALTANECVTLSRLNQANLIPNSGSLTTGMLLHLKLNDCVITGALYVCPDTSGNSNPNATNDQAPPVVVASAPSPATGNVNVTASCTDPAGLACAKVCYLLDGYPLSLTCPTTSPYTYSFPSANVVDGAHTISAVGYNAAGISGTSAGVAVTTSNSKSATSYYFNGSTGNDTYNCTSATFVSGTTGPCLSETKLQTLILTGGDTVNMTGTIPWAASYTLCAGNSIVSGTGNASCATQNYFPSNTGPLTYNGGNSCNPFTLTSTNCAVLNTGSLTNAVNLINPSHVVWENTAIFGNSTALGNANCASSGTNAAGAGISAVSVNGVTSDSLTIQNSWLQDFSCDIVVNEAGTGSPFTNVSILDNVSSGSTNTTTVDQCIRFGSGASGTVQGNLGFNCEGHVGGSQGNGIVILNYPSTAQTLVKFNVVHDFGANNSTCGGPVGIYATSVDNALFEFNELYLGWPVGKPVPTNICDNDPFDIDHGSSRVTMQYNYAHDSPPQSAGIAININSETGNLWKNNTVRYNILENTGSCFNGGNVGAPSGTNSYIYNNTCSINVGAVPNQPPVCWENVSDAALANNICIYTGTVLGIMYTNIITNTPTTPTGLFVNNDFFAPNLNGANTPAWRAGPFGAGINYSTLSAYQTATGFEANSLNVDPQFVGTPGTGGTCWGGGTSPPAGPQNAPSAGCPTPYVLSGANLKGKGVDVSTLPGTPPANPTTDYYGNLISSPPNIGAYGGS